MKRSKKICISEGCTSKRTADLTWHEYLGTREEERFWGPNVKIEVWQCEECGNQKENYKESGVRHRRYPYYNESTGQTFQDKEHEKNFVKENKLEALGSKEKMRDVKF